MGKTLGTTAAALFLGACILLIYAGHSWEGVTLAVVFIIAAAIATPPRPR